MFQRKVRTRRMHCNSIQQVRIARDGHVDTCTHAAWSKLLASLGQSAQPNCPMGLGTKQSYNPKIELGDPEVCVRWPLVAKR